jgi:hypothetical protein
MRDEPGAVPEERHTITGAELAVISDSSTGIVLSRAENGNPVITLNGPDSVIDWADIFIPLPGITDTGSGFSVTFVDLTFRNIDNSITDLNVNIDNPIGTEAIILRPHVDILHNGNGGDIRKNADGTVTMRLDISRVYHYFSGKTEKGIRIKMFVESMPELFKINDYDRFGSLEFVGVEYFYIKPTETVSLLRRKVNEFRASNIEARRLESAVLETHDDFNIFKQDIAALRASQLKTKAVNDSFLGTRRFENKDDEYKKSHLLPILHGLKSAVYTKGDDTYSLVKFLHDFADSISSGDGATDYTTAVNIYKTLLPAAAASGDLKRQISITCRMALAIGNTKGWHNNQEIIDCIEKLFEEIPEEYFLDNFSEFLAYEVHEDYLRCKYIWANNHLSHFDCDFEKLLSVFDCAERFFEQVKAKAIPIKWRYIGNDFTGRKLHMGNLCEFGKREPMSREFAAEHYLYLQNNMDKYCKNTLCPEAWEEFRPENNISDDSRRLAFLKKTYDPDTHSLACSIWPQTAYRAGKISEAEYGRFLAQAAKIIMARPIDTEAGHGAYQRRIADCVNCVAIICKYYNARHENGEPMMDSDTQSAYKTLAEKCLRWLGDFPIKHRLAFTSLGAEIIAIWKVAGGGLTKRQKAERLMKLTTLGSYAHSVLCAEMSAAISQKMLEKYFDEYSAIFPGMTAEQMLDEIYIGAMLHDIGKAEVPQPIAEIFRDIYDEEYLTIKTHPLRSIKYLECGEWDAALSCAVFHHLNYDGSDAWTSYPSLTHPKITPKLRELFELHAIHIGVVRFADCYVTVLDHNKNGGVVNKTGKDMLEELAGLSEKAAFNMGGDEKLKFPKKAEGVIMYDPRISKTIAEAPELYNRYTDDELVMDWVDSVYRRIHMLFKERTATFVDTAIIPEMFDADSLAPPVQDAGLYRRTVTLGQFVITDPSWLQAKGWTNDFDWAANRIRPWTAADFINSRYLVLEFETAPDENIEFIWLGDANDWTWRQASITPEGNVLVIDLRQIADYNLYVRCKFIKIYIGCHSWDDLTLKDAYFAE